MFLILGGTTEARTIADSLNSQGYPLIYSTVTDYGSELFNKKIKSHSEPLNYKDLITFSKYNEITEIIDATHPFAQNITQNARKVSNELNIKYYRFEREHCKVPKEAKLFSSQLEAANYLKDQSGIILLTTGSKKLADWEAISKKRMIIRVLPLVSVLEKCKNLGFKANQIIAQQGPFTYEENCAQIRRYKAAFLVTKESGVNSGFSEKVQAALDCHSFPIVIKRPHQFKEDQVFTNINDLLKAVTK